MKPVNITEQIAAAAFFLGALLLAALIIYLALGADL
jgi:hypothetical protein